ncbi:MAG TPA: protein kinase [Pyrinomonadaceae bacterium]|jgi:serine/threonine protein kinase/ketosteroid isomerase-like protein
MKICRTCQRCYEDADERCVVPEHGALAHARPGPRLISDKYRLDRLLGRGGMGAVYLATHVELERQVAIKLLLPDSVTDPQALERFRREARAAAKINHPNVAATYDYGSLPDGEAYLVMELIAGQTLREYLLAQGALAPDEAAAIARDVAAGIDAAHHYGVIHRDLKPSNIILTRTHQGVLQPKVVDFGIAKLKELSTTGGASDLTAAGALIGTPRYMSPEQCAGLEADARSDIYTLGIILYEMIAGRTPFDAPSATALALKHVRELAPDITRLRPDLPPDLAAVIMQALAKDPSERPQTAADFAQLLAPFAAVSAHAHLSDPPGAHVSAEGQVSARVRSGTSGGRLQPGFAVSPTGDVPAHATPTGSQPAGGATAHKQAVTEPGHATTNPELDESASPVESAPTDKSVPTDESVPRSDSLSRPGAEVERAPAAAREAAARTPPVYLAQTDAAIAAPDNSFDDEPTRVSPRRPPARRSSFSPLLLVGLVAFLLLGATLVWLATRSKPAAPQATRTDDAGAPSNAPAPLPSASVAPTPQTSPTPAPTVEPRAAASERAALRAALDDWLAATNAADLERVMSFYPAAVENYYLAGPTTRAQVRASKEQLLAQPGGISVRRTGDPQINISADGQTATLVFHKPYVTGPAEDRRSHEVLQELRWRKTPRGWQIVSERDLQVFR